MKDALVQAVRVVPALVTVLVFYSASVRAAIDSEKLNKSTVKITVKHGGGIAVGAGVILCHQNGMLYVLTAKHVLYGSAGKPLAGVSAVEVEFYQNRWPALTGERGSFEIKRAANKDLAMLQAKMAGEQRVERAMIGSSTGIKQLEEVFTTGHPVSVSKNWFPMKGEVNEAGEFILYSANVEEGYSGGPLVNQKGELIGINVQVAEQGPKVAQALPIDEVLSTIKPWLNLECLHKKGAAAAEEEPDKPGQSLYDLFERFNALRASGSKDIAAYQSWGQRTQAAVQAQYPESRTARELERLNASLQSVRNEHELNEALSEMEYTFEDLGEELETIIRGGSLKSQATDIWAGSYVLSGTRDAYGYSYASPYVQGTLTIQTIGANQYVLAWQSTILQTHLAQTVTGTLTGNFFSGTISNSSMVVNNGWVWTATFSITPEGMSMILADGATWFWRKQ